MQRYNILLPSDMIAYKTPLVLITDAAAHIQLMLVDYTVLSSPSLQYHQ